MSFLRRLLKEIHRRSLWQVLGIYVLGGWVALQVVQTLTESLGLPDWFPAFAVILLIAGLPIVLATAFIQHDGSPAVVPEQPPEPADVPAAADRRPAPEPEPSVGHRLFTWRNAVAGGVAAFALWGVVAAGWVLLGGGVAAAPDGAARRPAVAVLPFEDLAGDADSRPFTLGIHDDVLTQLSKIESLAVISRTSVREYAETTKNLREIAAELGVDAVLEGGVQRAGERVRVNAQLIDAATDRHLWAETFDRELTPENIFAIQSEIARSIAGALRATLTDAEEERLAALPTASLEAYDLYVRGRSYIGGSYASEVGERMVEAFQGAVEADPTFAEAWAHLSEAHSRAYFLRHDRTPERAELARHAAERAVALAPESGLARRAEGVYHYQIEADYDAALADLDRAVTLLPGDATTIRRRGYVLRRQGRFDRALADLHRAAQLDPRVPAVHYELGTTYHFMHRYAEAVPHFDRALVLEPANGNAHAVKVATVVSATGDTRRGRALLERFPDWPDPRQPYYYFEMRFGLADGEPRAVLDGWPDDGPEMLAGQYWAYPPDLHRAQIGQALGEPVRPLYDSARIALEARLRDRPDDHRLLISLAQARAGLGDEQEALRLARRALELHNPDNDALDGTWTLLNVGTVHAMLGRADDAFRILEQAAGRPGRANPFILRGHPGLLPLRDDPRWEHLVELAGRPARLAARDR